MHSPEIDDGKLEHEIKLISIQHDSKTSPLKMIPDAYNSNTDVKDAEGARICDNIEDDSNETLRTWFLRITEMQNEIQRKLTQTDASRIHPQDPFQLPPSHSHFQPTSTVHKSCSHSTTTSTTSSTLSHAQPTSQSRVLKYQDLPYMGEMTLDNSKPRRGRKPKKADICHLIYKNYGTIFPGTPNPNSLLDRGSKKSVGMTYLKPANSTLQATKPSEPDGLNRTNVHHRIISSLLEKRLTQETHGRNHLQGVPGNGTNSASRKRKTTVSTASVSNDSEPLNLCIRDLDHLKIRLNDFSTFKNYVSHCEDNVRVKQELQQSDEDVEFVHETPSLILPSGELQGLLATGGAVLPQDIVRVPEKGYVYWPHAGVFIHPMALHQQFLLYQRMCQQQAPGANLGSTTPPLHSLSILKHPKQSRPHSTKSETSEDENKSNIGGSSGTLDKIDKSPAKRKRSAIFIPPIPPENQSNPATEVSICKFKFTGGAKPSLQEKKMLSVDSGGNFRYYSGTGDKSMRGYEFFPRETLQQQVHTQGSSTGAFLQASGERIYPSSPINFTSKVNEFMLTPNLKPSPSQFDSSSMPVTVSDAMMPNKKRKSRKSLQRERLEQTFKEKGFLIQTQQLESAEGATYCKFRQLRKFTRYLFRSWKDYLPGNVSENQDGKGAACGVGEPRADLVIPDADDLNDEHESMSNLSSPGAQEESTSPSPI